MVTRSSRAIVVFFRLTNSPEDMRLSTFQEFWDSKIKRSDFKRFKKNKSVIQNNFFFKPLNAIYLFNSVTVNCEFFTKKIISIPVDLVENRNSLENPLQPCVFESGF